MPFLCEPIVETQFAGLKDVDGWISANEDRLERVPIRELIEKGYRFFDDEYFGDENGFLVPMLCVGTREQGHVWRSQRFENFT